MNNKSHEDSYIGEKMIDVAIHANPRERITEILAGTEQDFDPDWTYSGQEFLSREEDWKQLLDVNKKLIAQKGIHNLAGTEQDFDPDWTYSGQEFLSREEDWEQLRKINGQNTAEVADE